jgi:hypothetical protein
MLGRRDVKVGDYMRRVIEPMAVRLGLNYDETFFTPPTTDERVAFEAYRSGLSLLMAFTYDDGWGTTTMFGDQPSHKLAKKAAKAFRGGLLEERGRDAISLMAQGYARATAEIWRRAREDPEHAEHIEALAANAEKSEALGRLAAQIWPVDERRPALLSLRQTRDHTVTQLDNPNQMIDIRGAVEHTQAACEAAAVALGNDYEKYSRLLLGPVYSLNLELAQGLQTDWVGQMDSWMNLLSGEPVPFSVIAQATNAS